MRTIIHEPTGLDDPYLPLPGKERSPRDPLEDQAVSLAFVTIPSQTGQRAWVKVKTPHKVYSVRAQLQYSIGEEAFWLAQIEPEEAGTEVVYEIFAGRGPKSCISSPPYRYRVMKWTDESSIPVNESSFVTPIRSDSNRISSLISTHFLSDGNNVFDMEMVFERIPGEHFFGLGEHFDSIRLKPNSQRLVYVFDQYKVQQDRGYAPVPFIFSNKGRGILVDTGFMTSYLIGEETLTIRVHTKGHPLKNTEIHFWKEDSPLEVISRIYSLSDPVTPPLWALGPWISANQWNNQEKIMHALRRSLELDLPVTALVIEAWSDEQSFYIFRGAANTPVTGDETLKLSDFDFHNPWPDPLSMIEELHRHGVRLLLWQIPALKNVDDPTPQHAKDIAYAKERGFLVKNDKGSLYTIPRGRWFEDSFVTDMMNEEAANWWASKRRYLFEELGVDGLKTDGGEHIWRRDTVAGGASAAESRNLFPEHYFRAAKSAVGEDGLLFSRAGYTRSPSSSIFWVGDEDSTWEALRSNITAGLNVSMSGNPFWGWDIAGFSGELPSPKLYKRAIELAVFTPIFQIHSEDPGDPDPSSERTAWNMAEQFHDESIIDHYRRYASLRMSISPYIYEEAILSSQECHPLTIPLFLIEEKNDPEILAYLFGRNMLVVPSVDEYPENRQIVFPSGEWINMWDGKSFRGSAEITGDSCQVFLRKNSQISLSVPDSGHLFDKNWSQVANSLLVATYDMGEVKNANEEAIGRGLSMIGAIGGTKNGIIQIDWKDVDGGR